MPGWRQVDNLTECLVNLSGLSVTNDQVKEIISLYNKLEDFDQGRTQYVPRHKDKLAKGRFKATKQKTAVTPGVDSVKRSAINVLVKQAVFKLMC